MNQKLPAMHRRGATLGFGAENSQFYSFSVCLVRHYSWCCTRLDLACNHHADCIYYPAQIYFIGTEGRLRSHARCDRYRIYL